MSNTILLGEKHVPPALFGQPWIDSSLYNAMVYPSWGRSGGPAYPLARSVDDWIWAFGSYHPGIVQFTFADGSVRSVTTELDPTILGYLVDRADDQQIPNTFQ